MENPVRVHALHGFLGLPSDWDFMKAPLEGKAHVENVDIFRVLSPATGASPWDWAKVFNQKIRAEKTSEFRVLLGYSMGGRLAMHALLEDPALWDAVVLVGANPGHRDEQTSERNDRIVSDECWAKRFETEPWSEISAVWESLPVFGGNPFPFERTEAQFDRRDLAGALRNWSVGRQESLTEKIAQTKNPLLWIAGEHDTRYVSFGKAIGRDVRLWIAPGCAHRVPWEAQEGFLEHFCGFLGTVFVKEVAVACNLRRKYMMTPSSHTTPSDQSGPVTWSPMKKHYKDIKLEKSSDGIAKVTINRPERRNAFRPETVEELKEAFEICRQDGSVGVVILTGEGNEAFCSGGDQKIRGSAGYIGGDGVPRLNVLDLQKQIRGLPKPVIAMVAGYAIGGGHVLHIVCDLTIAAENARFGQTGPKVGSFDGGLGSSYLARIVGQKKAREIWFLCRQYNAQEAFDMGLVNKVVPIEQLETETVQWCREILRMSPMALRCLKTALNADCDGQMGLLDLAGNATLLYYMSEEAQEGKNAFVEKRAPDFSKFPRLP